LRQNKLCGHAAGNADIALPGNAAGRWNRESKNRYPGQEQKKQGFFMTTAFFKRIQHVREYVLIMPYQRLFFQQFFLILQGYFEVRNRFYHCPHGSLTTTAGFCPSENVISMVHVLSPLINCMVCFPDMTFTYPTFVFPTGWPSIKTDATGGKEEMKAVAGFPGSCGS
jgi:hypothetical protein